MPELTHTIEVKREYRPVMVKQMVNDVQYIEVRGLFHTWVTDAYPTEPSPFVGGAPGGHVTKTYALVELEDGTVRRCRARDIRFLDTGHVMGSIAWENLKPKEAQDE